MIDPWAAGYTGPEDDPGRGGSRRPLTWVRSEPGEQRLRPPGRGPRGDVDLDAMEVVAGRRPRRRADPAGARQLRRRADGGAGQRAVASRRRAPTSSRSRSPSPRAPSFTVDGHHVRWQKWRVRVGFTPREGSSCTTLGLRRTRADPLPRVARGDVRPLRRPGADAPPQERLRRRRVRHRHAAPTRSSSAATASARSTTSTRVVNDQDGEPATIQNAICMHEEDYGIALEAHRLPRPSEVEVRRSRRLVVSSIATVGNYEYGFFWYLYQDGTIEFEVKLTGIISTGRRARGRAPRRRHGTLVAPGLYGPHHQHFFNVRLDIDVDGTANSVVRGRRRRRCRRGRRTRTGTPGRRGARRCAARARRSGQIDPPAARSWTIVQPGEASTRSASRSAYKLDARRERRAVFAARVAPSRSAPASPTSTSG